MLCGVSAAQDSLLLLMQGLSQYVRLTETGCDSQPSTVIDVHLVFSLVLKMHIQL